MGLRRNTRHRLDDLKQKIEVEEKRMDEALKLNMALHESGMETIANLEKALDEHCRTVCNKDVQRAKDSALRKAIEQEQEELRRRIEAMKEEYNIYDTQKLPPIQALLGNKEPEGECA